MVNCSNCGAAVDLALASACAHCGTPLSMLDLNQIDKMAAHLRRADEESRAIDPMLPQKLTREKEAVDALFAALRADAGDSRTASPGLVEMGLKLITGWFR
jgi:hypothetical protein